MEQQAKATDLYAEANESQFKAKAKIGNAWKQETCRREPNFFTINRVQFGAPTAWSRGTGEQETETRSRLFCEIIFSMMLLSPSISMSQ